MNQPVMNQPVMNQPVMNQPVIDNITIHEVASTRSTTLCLNMIVKNESKIIERLLESVSTIIDSYCICDTGSTDNTIDLIQTFFKQRNIPGQIVQEPFQDFGYNRSIALKACETIESDGKSIIHLADYILLLDADMIFWLNPKIHAKQFKQTLTEDIYNIFQGTDYFFYKNTRIVKNRGGFSYWGVTHEYVKAPAGSKTAQFERDFCFIKDIGDGGCKTDKFLRDIKLLTKGLEDVPNNDRYTFYLANSYRDAGQYEKSIETFKKRVELGGWIEEVWYSYFSIGRCYKFLNDWPNAIYYWLEAYAYHPKRIENLYEIIHYYRNAGKNDLAYTFFALADYQRKKNTSWDYLFLQKDIYDYKIDYEMSIIGYYCNRDNFDLTGTCMKVLAYPGADDGTCKNVLANYKFYTKALNQLSKNAISSDNIKILQSIGKDRMLNFPEFVSSTPSICTSTNSSTNKSIITICVRYVNYKIDQEGKYINQNYIETKNIVANVDISAVEWKILDEYELEYDKSKDNVYVGLEDVRLMTKQSDIIYCANRGLANSNIVIEYGQINHTTNQTTIPCNFLKYSNQQPVEKNWSIFESTHQTVKCIYKWYPITIGDISPENQFENTHMIPTPNFFRYMRGSTPGAIIPTNQCYDGKGEELWFINHIVSHEDRRYYYHIMIVLDRETYKLKRYTPLWTFEKAKVEYTLGMVYLKQSNELMIGYSIMDKETKYMTVPKTMFDNMMILV